MIYANIWLTVKDPADVAEISDLLREQCRLSRLEPGCERFEVYQSKNEPVKFLLVERWASQVHLDAHRLALAYTTVYAPKVIPRVERVAHPCDLLMD